MLVDSPRPGVAAGWHRALNVAAAKLAVAAGITPAEVRRVSGLHRVEIRRDRRQTLRHITALAHAGVLTAEHIPDELISGDETARRIETGPRAGELGAQYLAISARARRYERLHIYFDQTEAFTQEYKVISDEFFRCQKKVKELEDEYELIGEQLAALANSIANSTPWPTRRKRLDQMDDCVRRRDSLRAIFARTCQETGTVMEHFRFHHAKRVFYHSRHVPEFRSEAMVFVPSSTLHKMLVCPFEEVQAEPAMRDKALRLMREWNLYCEQFAVEKRSIQQEHKQDELLDHTLRASLANRAGSAQPGRICLEGEAQG